MTAQWKWEGGFDTLPAAHAVMDAAERAAKRIADDVLETSQALVPDDPQTGSDDLKSSGKVTEIRLGPGAGVAAVSYDGKHAVIQHETLDYEHRSGESAKFLEKALAAAESTADAIVAEEVRKALS